MKMSYAIKGPWLPTSLLRKLRFMIDITALKTHLRNATTTKKYRQCTKANRKVMKMHVASPKEMDFVYERCQKQLD